MERAELKKRLWRLIADEGIIVTNDNLDWLLERVYKEQEAEMRGNFDEWVSADEDTPPRHYEIRKTYFDRVSRNVLVKLASGEIVKGYYDYHEYLWRYERNSLLIKEKVIAWKDK